MGGGGGTVVSNLIRTIINIIDFHSKYGIIDTNKLP